MRRVQASQPPEEDMKLRASPALAVTALALAACTDAKSAPMPEKPADNAPLVVTAAKAQVALGDAIVFHVKVTNTGKASAKVPVPRLDRAGLSFRVKRPDGS